MTTRSALYTGPTAADLTHLPATLQAHRQWVLWRGADRVDEQTGEIKLNKIPIDPQTLQSADTTDSTTWGSFEPCCAALPVALEEWEHAHPAAYRGGGIGFVFTADDPYIGIDLDTCRDPETGTIEPWAQEILDDFQSYTEVTPSRTGLHILAQGVLPPRGRKKGKIEMYNDRRFFTMTGWQLPQSPSSVTACQEALTALHARIFGDMVTSPGPAAPVSMTLEDTDLLAKAKAAKNGAKFAQLWSGDTSLHGGDDSVADLALCCQLAFWTQDPEQLDRLFRQSGLMRQKWDERRGAQTYGVRTVQEALARQIEHYHPREDAQQRRNGTAPGPEPSDPYACPKLPDYAHTQDDLAAEASLFLDDYIKLSTKWAPRAYEGFHEAVALFLLATIAARRIKLLFGPRGTYTSLYIALAARTTVYTKSTAADIGLALLDAAGLSWLLADDDSTPQAFLRSLSLYVPSNYADMPPEDQSHLRRQLAFTAQRGWFYEEWGQHLEAMMQKNGYMASFRGIMRRLDDHRARYASNTIARGREILHKPCVSLLANVTPSDLQPFVKARAPLWRDGYIARFAFVTPDQAEASAAEFPEGSLTFPGYIVTALQHWHRRLGIPACTLTPQTDKKGQPTGSYTIDVDPLPEKVYTLSPEVRTAYYAYDRAMRDLTRQRKDEDLDGSYGRFPMKALRIAGLLASLHDDSDSYTVWPRQWWRGQQIVERWRRDLHRLRRQVQQSEAAPSVKRQLEEKLLRQVDRSGPQSMREFAIFQKAHSRDEIEACVTVLVATGELTTRLTTQTTKYLRPTEGGQKV